ncbi:hypothetical protein ANO11243_083910 [Dothideomycetidae sp. 11243]|nr:hypothetical protein ANO11243_083910 [fungal sp. No.11243]
MALIISTLVALVSLVSAATFSATAKTNVAVYWGQGSYQARLVETCMNPNVDIVILAFVNMFPDQQGSGGYPGTNFGNACGTCKYIGPDIDTCQKTYGKKVLLSLGGGYPLNYFIAGPQRAVDFAQFMWGAFGPPTEAWFNAKKPRPFGNAIVDGFDFDIESEIVPAPTYNGVTINNYMTRGYAKMIQTFKNDLFPKDTTKNYYLSGAPQCAVPDAHLGTVVQQAWFDFLFIQFYNTASCSARAGVQHIQGKSKNDIGYNNWANVNFYNKNVKLYIGLPANVNASGSSDYYLPPQDAYTLFKKYLPDSKFGGAMLWEATYGMNNVVCARLST